MATIVVWRVVRRKVFLRAIFCKRITGFQIFSSLRLRRAEKEPITFASPLNLYAWLHRAEDFAGAGHLAGGKLLSIPASSHPIFGIAGNRRTGAGVDKRGW
jgi:hypothetical protein